MKKYLFFFLLPLLLTPAFQAGAGEAHTYAGSAIIFVTGDGSRRDIMLAEYDQKGALGEPRLLAGEKGIMETQPVLGPRGETAWVRRVGEKWELLKNGEVISSGPLHLSPAFRPDGALVAAISGNEETSLYLFNGKTPTLLVKGEGMAVSPAFSPDGKYLAYVSDQTGQGQIHAADADGTNPRLLTPSAMLNTDPAWSPDGSYIAFVSNETDIFIMKADGSELRALTKNQGVNRRPAFSPNGAEIVFSSDRDGRFKLYAMRADGSEPRILLPGLEAPQHAPCWGALPILPEPFTTQKVLPQKD